MKNFFTNDLLPEGFNVLLPDVASKEEYISRVILDFFSRNGYLLVKTPMMEYEDKKSENTLKYLNNNSFMLLENESKKVLIIRPDITPQVVKLASTKLRHLYRPLRLAYSGEVIRNIKNNYKSERQFKQIGVEVLGGPYYGSIEEILKTSIKVLSTLNIKNITLDFSIPAISRFIDKTLDTKKKSNKAIKEALINKDTSVIKEKKYTYVNNLIFLSGSVEKAKKEFKKYNFPKTVHKMLDDFFKLSLTIKKKFPDLSITVDITEGDSFLEYEKYGFKVYNKDNASPVAIGGDYKVNNNELGIGVTFLLNKIIESVKIKKQKKVYIPYTIKNKSIKIHRNFIQIKELFPKKNARKEALKQGCDYMLKSNGELEKV
tara:strand:+ start:58 stop:1179 length:1122 start_codon:yes stop_codon:yes gene_type:complete